MRNETDKGAVNVGRHRRSCTICAHEKCADVEAGFVNWESPAKLAEEYGLADRTTVYRHAHALGLFEKRKRNVRAALERIIEKSGEVEVTASAVVAAIQPTRRSTLRDTGLSAMSMSTCCAAMLTNKFPEP